MHHARFPRVFFGLALVAVMAVAAACSNDDPVTPTSIGLPIGAPAGLASGIDGLSTSLGGASAGIAPIISQQVG